MRCPRCQHENKLTVIASAAFIAASQLFSFSLFAASAPAQAVFTFGGVNERSGVLFVGRAAGIFQKDGIDPTVVNVRNAQVIKRWQDHLLLVHENELARGGPYDRAFTMPQGHPDYRFITQEMWRKIQEVHPMLAEVGRFIDWKSYRLGRLHFGIWTESKKLPFE